MTKRWRVATAVAIGGLLVGGMGGSAYASAEDQSEVLDALSTTSQAEAAPNVLDDAASAEEAGVIIPGTSEEPVVVGSATTSTFRMGHRSKASKTVASLW